MRDLYHRLGIEPKSTDDQIRAALSSKNMDDALRADAEHVLLNPQHRVPYDRTHRLLTTVGTLRTRLDLQLRPFWARSGNQDFTAPAHRARVNPIGVVQSLDHHHQPRHQRLIRFVIGVAVGAVIAWVIWTFKK